MGELVKVCLASNPVVQASVFIPEGTKWPTLQNLISDRLGLPNFRIHHLKLISTSAKSAELTDPAEIRKFLSDNDNKGVICMVYEDTTAVPENKSTADETERNQKIEKRFIPPTAPSNAISKEGSNTRTSPSRFRKSLADLMADIDANSKTFDDISISDSTVQTTLDSQVVDATFRVRLSNEPTVVKEVTTKYASDWNSVCSAIADVFHIENINTIQRISLVSGRNVTKIGRLFSSADVWAAVKDCESDDVFEVHLYISVLKSLSSPLSPKPRESSASIALESLAAKGLESPPAKTSLASESISSSGLESSSKVIDSLSPKNVEGMLSAKDMIHSKYGSVGDLVGSFHVRLASDPSKRADISVLIDCSWEELIQGIATGFLGLIKPNSIQTLVLVDSDGDEMSGLIATAEKFWSIYNRHVGSVSRVLFHVHLEPVSRNAAKAVALERAREAARSKVKKRLEEDIRGKQVVPDMQRKIDQIHADVEQMRVGVPDQPIPNAYAFAKIGRSSPASEASAHISASENTYSANSAPVKPVPAQELNPAPPREPEEAIAISSVFSDLLSQNSPSSITTSQSTNVAIYSVLSNVSSEILTEQNEKITPDPYNALSSVSAALLSTDPADPDDPVQQKYPGISKLSSGLLSSAPGFLSEGRLSDSAESIIAGKNEPEQELSDAALSILAEKSTAEASSMELSEYSSAILAQADKDVALQVDEGGISLYDKPLSDVSVNILNVMLKESTVADNKLKDTAVDIHASSALYLENENDQTHADIGLNSSGSDISTPRNKFRVNKKARAASVAESKLREALAKSQAKRVVEDDKKPEAEELSPPSTTIISPIVSSAAINVVDNLSPGKEETSIAPDVVTAKFCLSTDRSQVIEVPIPASSSWEDLKELIANGFSVHSSRVSYFFLIDEDGDEMSPVLNTAERFMKFLSHYSELECMSFSVILDQPDSTSSQEIAEPELQLAVEQKVVDSETSVLDSSLSPQDLAFRKACCEGDLLTARKMLSHGVDVYAKDSEGHQAMHLACISGHLEVVQWLVGTGVSLLNVDNNGMTPLHHACDGTHVGVSLFLVKSGANMLLEDNAGLTPLHCIALQGLIQLAHLLRPHVTSLCSSSGLTLLHCACNGGHEEMVSFLLKNKARVIVKDNEGMCPLHHACLNGHFSVAKILIDCGAYHSSRDNEGMSPLLYACSEGHLSIVQWLVSIGASLFVRNNFRDGALHLACQTGLLDLAKWLVRNGIPLNLRNKNDKSAYDIAKAEGHEAVCTFLESVSGGKPEPDDNDVRSAADVDFEECLIRKKESEEEQELITRTAAEAVSELSPLGRERDAFGDDSSVMSAGNETFSSTPGVDSHFRECCAKGDTVTVMRMLALGISPEACSANGSKPLHFACAGGHLEIAQELVRMGASINVVNFKGSSPLHFACYWQHEALSLWLIGEGANLTVHNADGFTPLHYVCMLGQASLLRQIIHLVGSIDLGSSHESAPPLLHCASDHGHEEIISILADIGGVMDAQDNQGQTAMHYACRSGELAAVQCLVRCNASVDIKDKDGNTAILIACLSQNVELVRWLANFGSSLYACNSNGDTCLHIACRAGSQELVEWLIERGADIVATNEDGLSAVEVALQSGHSEVAALITSLTKIKAAADSEGQSESFLHDEDGNRVKREMVMEEGNETTADDDANTSQFSNLKEYCMNGDIEAVLSVIRAGDPNMENRNGSTVMHFASASGHLKLCRKLLDVGVLPNKENNLGLTPFHCACINGHLALVKWFYLQTAGNLSDMTADGRTALHHACYNGHVNIVEWLLKSGADMTILNLDELTPFHDACYGGHIPVVAFLVNYGMSVMTVNYAGVTPLHVACSQGHLDLVQWLVAEGAQTDVPDEYQRTPFLNACLNGHLHIAKWLVEQGVNIHATGGVSDHLNTALHLACQNGHLDVVTWLADLGLDVNALNDHNETPLQFAMAGRHYHLSRWLISKRFSYFEEKLNHTEYPEIAEALCDKDKSRVTHLLEKVSEEADTLKHLKGVDPLHYFCTWGNMDLVQYYLRANKTKVNTKSAIGLTPLHCAAAKGHVNLVIFLLQYGADVDARDVEGSTAFIVSMYVQQGDICQLLFAEHIRSNLPDTSIDSTQPQTPGQGQAQVVMGNGAVRVANNSNIRVRSKKKSGQEDTVDCQVVGNPSIFSCIVPESPMAVEIKKSPAQHVSVDVSQSSMQSNRHATLKNALIARVNPNEEFDFSGAFFDPTMQDACLAGNFEEVRDIIANGANVNARNPANASTALHFACVYGDVKLVKFLLENGAMIDLRNIGGMTPAHIACDRKHSSLVVYLLRHGADSACRNKSGDTPLHYICSRGMLDVLTKVLELPALVKNYDIEVKSLQGLTPLHTAVDFGHLEMVDMLIRLGGVEVNSRDDENRTPLHYAALKGYLDVVELLWRRGGDVNSRDDKGRTALLYACISGYTPVLQWLVRHGADPHAVTDNGNGALHAACRFGDLNMVIWLVEIGVDPYLQNFEKSSPVQYAAQAGFADIVGWLSNEEIVRDVASRRKNEINKDASE